MQVQALDIGEFVGCFMMLITYIYLFENWKAKLFNLFPNFFQPVISLLEAKVIGFHGLVTRPLYEMPAGIGLLAEIIAAKCAWTWLVLRARLNKILFLV